MPEKQENSSLASTSRWNKPALKAGAIVAAAVLAIVMISVLSSDSSSEEHGPHVVVVEPSEVLELPTDVDPRQLVLEGKNHELSAGVFVTTKPDWEADEPHAPEGFLLKVEDWVVANGVTTVDVEPASLFEAMPQGTLSTLDKAFSPVESSTIEETSSEPVFARASPADEGEKPDGPVGETIEFLDKIFACGRNGDIEVGASVKTSLEPDAELDWSRTSRFSVRINSAAAWVDGIATASLGASAKGELSCESRPIKLPAPSWRTIVPVGPVPVPVTVSLPITLSAEAYAHGEASAMAEVESNATLGVSYERGEEPELKKGFKPPQLVSDFKPELDLTGTAEATVLPAMSIEVGWRAPGLGKLATAATLGVRTGINVSYAAGEQPPARICAPVKVEASLALYLLRKKLGPLLVTPFSRNLICRPRLPSGQESEGEGEPDQGS